MSRNRQDRVAKDHIKYCLARAKIASLIGGLLYSLFGFSSYPIMLHFDSNLSLWDNVWPRFLLSGVPMVALFFLLRWERWKPELRLILWAIGFSIMNCAVASQKIWAIAWVNPKILLYFSSANNLILVSMSIFLALPPRVAAFFYASYGLFFLAPLLFLASADSQVFFVIANDSLLAACVCVMVAMITRFSHKMPILEKHEHLDHTAKFLDQDLHSAIASGDVRSLSGRRDAFILQIDVRKYTQFLKEHDHDDALLLGFSQDLNAMVRNTVGACGGKMHKTAGDGYLCLFIDQGEERRTMLMAQAIEAFATISREFSGIVSRYGLKDMCICGGLHFGSVMFAIFGTETQQEYDVVSKNLSLAGRLEQHSKSLQNLARNSDILILSADAHRYLDEGKAGFSAHKIYLTAETIRSFSEIEEIHFIVFEKVAGTG